MEDFRKKHSMYQKCVAPVDLWEFLTLERVQEVRNGRSLCVRQLAGHTPSLRSCVHPTGTLPCAYPSLFPSESIFAGGLQRSITSCWSFVAQHWYPGSSHRLSLIFWSTGSSGVCRSSFQGSKCFFPSVTFRFSVRDDHSRHVWIFPGNFMSSISMNVNLSFQRTLLRNQPLSHNGASLPALIPPRLSGTLLGVSHS